MNCQTFEPTINDLARGQMMDATLRESALAHAEACKRCAARLADERALSANLRAFASSVEAMEAPAQVLTDLRAAFRQRNSSVEPAQALPASPARKQRWLQWATAAAAAIATVLAIQAFRLRESPAPLHKAVNVESNSQMLTSLLAAINAGQRNVPPLVNGEDSTPQRSPKNIARQSERPNYVEASNKNGRRATDAGTTQAESEIVTDFMPLTYGAALGPNEGGQLVRVELPRSALVSLGLPMNVDKLNERVKADVLLGQDGLARAIRFVR